jgi:hypothetical protein
MSSAAFNGMIIAALSKSSRGGEFGSTNWTLKCSDLWQSGTCRFELILQRGVWIVERCRARYGEVQLSMAEWDFPF